MGDPWEQSVVLLNLTEPLFAPSDAITGSPWAIQLSNGVRCINPVGANGTVDGVQMYYSCGQSSNGDTGMVNETTDPWTVQYTPNGQGPLVKEAVTTAWL